jgi:hypothetical protein
VTVPRTAALLLVALGLTGCPVGPDDDDSAIGDDDDSAEQPPPNVCLDGGLADACADEVVEAPGHTGEGYRDAERAVNGVRGGGETAGGTDVFSLGLSLGEDDHVVLRWSGRAVLNGPGLDFVIFENAFAAGQGVFMDLAVVEVSQDGLDWVAFEHDCVADDETAWSNDPDDHPGFAGRTPVLLHDEGHPVDPVDPELAGGDGFDLDDLAPDGGLADAIRADGFVFLRLTSAGTRTNPDTGEPFAHDPISDGSDIDGVYAALLADE